MYHTPALLRETLDALDVRPDGTYVDATYGGGGHTRELLRRLGPRGRVVAFDHDDEALRNALDDPRLTLVHANFRHLADVLEYMGGGTARVDGLMADLGVSSHHFDDAARGFSFRHQGPLDMRMNTHSALTAERVVTTYTPGQLTTVLREFGEVDRPQRLAQAIVDERQASDAPWTTQRLRALVERVAPGPDLNKTLAKLFQALRIEVNGELDALEALLRNAAHVVRPGGRLAVIAYHSLEDRMVKNLLRSGDPLSGDPEVDMVYGGTRRPWKAGTRRPIEPSDEEATSNPRARSAKLRWATRANDELTAA